MNDTFWNPPQGGNAAFPGFAVLCAIVFVASVSSIGGADKLRATNTVYSLAPGRFVEISQRLGVNFQHQASHTSKKYLPETMGSGVALFDYDNDGRLDIFFVNGALLSDPTPKGAIPQKTGPKYWNRLYHQKADGTFEDVTE